MLIQELFKLGMKREIPELLPPMAAAKIINLGAGNAIIPGTIGLDLPAWDANHDRIPYDNGSIAAIYAFHFLEHVDKPIALLRECERVLALGGMMLIVVPYGTGHLAAQDLTHQHFFNEETWKTLFANNYYDPEGREEPQRWQFQIHANFIMGISGQNLALFTQLVKGK